MRKLGVFFFSFLKKEKNKHTGTKQETERGIVEGKHQDPNPFRDFRDDGMLLHILLFIRLYHSTPLH